MARRFKVFISDNITEEGKEYLRVVPINARKQERGFGQATFQLLNKNGPLTDGRDGYEATDEIVKGQFIKIVDTQVGEQPSGIIWLGYITDIVRELYKGGNDFRGQIFASEIGHFYAQIPILDAYVDENQRKINSPPEFNQQIEDHFYANKNEGSFAFETSKLRRYASSSWSGNEDDQGSEVPEDDWKWSRAEVISLLLNDAPDLTWEVPSTEDNEFLNDKSIAQSYPSFYGQSITNMLDQMIPEPLSYYFDYSASMGGVELVVFSKTKEKIGKIPQTEVVNIDTTGQEGVVDVTVTTTQQQVDEVVVRGTPIIVCGTLSSDFDGKQTLNPRWLEAQLDEFIQGTNNEEGDPIDVFSLDEGSVNTFRQNYKDTYERFVFNTSGNIKAKVLVDNNPARKPSPFTAGDQTLKPFFPLFKTKGGDQGTDPLDVPEIESDNDSLHSTPLYQNLNFVNYLPIFKRNEIYLPGGDSISQGADELYTPQCWAYGRSPKQLGGFTYYWNDLLSPSSPFRCQLQYRPDGIVLKSPVRELLGYNDLTNNLWLDEKGDTNLRPANGSGTAEGPYKATYPKLNGEDGTRQLTIYGEWRDTNRDVPAGFTALVEAPFKCHWLRNLFTVAMESDQVLETRRNRTQIVNSGGNVGVINAPARVSRVFDCNYTVWFVHKGTVYDTEGVNDAGINKLKAFAEDTITRNDLPLLNELADVAWQWLTTVRTSLSIENQLMNFEFDQNSWLQIGKYIERYKDNAGPQQGRVASEWEVNSTISSIEYLFGDAPRLIINTEIPAEPLFAQLMGGE